MRFSFIAKHRLIWPVSWACGALGVSRSGFHAWLNRSPSRRAEYDEVLVAGIRFSFAGSDRTYGARRVWHDVLAEGLDAGLHRIERLLMRQQGLRARMRRPGPAQRWRSAPRRLAQHPGLSLRGVGAEPEVDRRLHLHLDGPGLAVCCMWRRSSISTPAGWWAGR